MSLHRSWCARYSDTLLVLLRMLSLLSWLPWWQAWHSSTSPTEARMQPPLPLTDEVTQAVQKHLERRYLALTPDQVGGPVHEACYLTRCMRAESGGSWKAESKFLERNAAPAA